MVHGGPARGRNRAHAQDNRDSTNKQMIKNNRN